MFNEAPGSVEATNVCIRYRVGDFKAIGLKEYVIRRLTGNYHATDFWANWDINFRLQPGDMLGVIGTNGAGKSTLLKAVTGIMVPTRGSVKHRGKISALLELASGFDPLLTVRENTFLRGAMLGYSREFMAEAYGQIIDFAELGEFEDRPFRQLSSGMKSRLAFSIASMVNPDILIVDEALSVGDGRFKRKSARKMKQILSSGATTILVTHSLKPILSMCNKVLWLEKGKQVDFTDQVRDCCIRYRRFLAGKLKIDV